MARSTEGRKVITRNKKAFHDYNIEDTYDAGIVLLGSEVKSIRNNRVNLRDGFVQEFDDELWLMNVHISPYEQGSTFGHADPLRPRKLLLHRREINRIISRIQERGYTVVPTQLYLERGLAKVEVALAKGKKLYDKRQTMAKRDAERQIDRALKERY
jgi:SsrA-binding protein